MLAILASACRVAVPLPALTRSITAVRSVSDTKRSMPIFTGIDPLPDGDLTEAVAVKVSPAPAFSGGAAASVQIRMNPARSRARALIRILVSPALWVGAAIIARDLRGTTVNSARG